MKKIFTYFFALVAFPMTSVAQNWECKYVDLGQGIVEQTVLLIENDSVFGFVCKDSVNADFVAQLEQRIPGYDEILEIDFGPTTFIYTIDGSAIVFRKCVSVSGTGTVAGNSGNNNPPDDEKQE